MKSLLSMTGNLPITRFLRPSACVVLAVSAMCPVCSVRHPSGLYPDLLPSPLPGYPTSSQFGVGFSRSSLDSPSHSDQCHLHSSAVRFALPISAITRFWQFCCPTPLPGYPTSSLSIPVWRTFQRFQDPCGTARGSPTSPLLACWGGATFGCGPWGVLTFSG